jgi:hypothetical protein
MFGHDDTWQRFGVFGNLFHVNNSGDVQAAVANVHAYSRHLLAIRDNEYINCA